MQSPGLSDQTADNSCHDDASSTGAKDDEEDDEDEDDKLEGLTCGDPEKLKAFNVSIWLKVFYKRKIVKWLRTVVIWREKSRVIGRINGKTNTIHCKYCIRKFVKWLSVELCK